MEIVCPAWCAGVDKLVQAIPVLADQGVTAIEVWPHVPQYFDHHQAVELQDVMSQLSRCGVRVHSVHMPFGPAYDISSFDDEVHERGVDALIDSIELANLMDAGSVIVHASDKITEGPNRRFERARGVLREMAVVVEESGVVLALENLPPSYLGHTPDEVFELIDGIDRRLIGVCFDSGHANLSGHFEQFAEALLPASVATHLHDNDGTGDHHSFPGHGNIDWRRFAEIYRNSGCEASIMLECDPPDNMAWSAAFQRFRSALGD